MNVRLLLEVKEAILRQPELYKQENWIEKEDCGTTACIAGWTCLLSNRREAEKQLEFSPFGSFAKDEARHLLGIDFEEAEELFIYWNDEFKTRLFEAKTPREKAQVGADYIDYFISKYGDL